MPDRLVERIRLSGMSYSRVAREIGVQQPTISRLAKGHQHSTTRLPKLARVLGTTTAYLEGETDDPGSDQPDRPVPSDEDAEMFELISGLDPEDKAAIMQLARRFASSARSPTVHAGGQKFRGQGSR